MQAGLMAAVTVTTHPELVRIITPGEDLAQFLKAGLCAGAETFYFAQVAPEKILCRWVNYHLSRGGSTRTMDNFSSDIKACMYGWMEVLWRPAGL